MVRCERAVCNGAGKMDCTTDGIKDELNLLATGSTSELQPDDTWTSGRLYFLRYLEHLKRQ